MVSNNKHLPLWIRIRGLERLWRKNETNRLLRGSGAKVRYIGHKQLIKFQCHPIEFEAMEFVRQNTTIPIPKVFGAYTREDGSQDLVLELVPGLTLDVAWQFLTLEQKAGIARELAGYISQLRCLQLPKDGFVGSLRLGSGYDHRLGGRRFGPFESIADFHEFVRRGDAVDSWAFDKDVTKVHNKSNSYVTKFTHAGMSPENIMVKDGKITAIIDWEFGGWFPEYWEYTKMYYGWRPYREDFYHEMDNVLTTYPEELAADNTLLKLYDTWAYDNDRPRRSADEQNWLEWDAGMRRRIVQDSIPPYTSANPPADIPGS